VIQQSSIEVGEFSATRDISTGDLPERYQCCWTLPKPHTRWIQMYVVDALADLGTKYERPASCQRTSRVACFCEDW